LAPSRLATREVTIGSHTLEAGTKIMSNIYAAHTDPTIWPDPLVFRPKRHIGIVTERLITFGSGRRACPGEVLARAETFLLFTNIIAGFLVEEGPGGPPCLDGPAGLTVGPRPFTVRVRARMGT
jgi:cytochrome P450